MQVCQAIKMACRSILTKKGRTALTMLGIIIGVTSVIILVSVVQGSNHRMMEYYERLGTNKLTVDIFTAQDIRQDLYQFCARYSKWIAGITPERYVSGPIICRIQNTDNMEHGGPDILLGSDQFSLCNNFQIRLGRDISCIDIKNYQNVVVLGARTAEYLFGFTNPLGETVSIAGQSFTVVGVYEAKDPDSDYSMDNIAVLPESANRVLGNNEPFTTFIIKARNSAAISNIMSVLGAFLETLVGPSNFSFYSENQYIQDSNRENDVLSMTLGGIAGISLLVGGIGIMNIMLVTVSERTKEIGIRKAIGASRSSILCQFLVESALVCLLGGLLGIALGIFGTLIAGKIILNMVLVPSVSLSLGASLFSVLLGIVFGMYPAVKASGMTPVEAFRIGNQ